MLPTLGSRITVKAIVVLKLFAGTPFSRGNEMSVDAARIHALTFFSLLILVSCGFAKSVKAQSGEQVINGTRVFTVIDQSRGVATFSNQCGSQTLTQRQLQQGAIPSDIIPCPRPRSQTNDGARRAIEAERREAERLNQQREEARQEEELRQDAQEEGDTQYKEGAVYENNKEYMDAKSSYEAAATSYNQSGASAMEAKAKRSADRVVCNYTLEAFDRSLKQGNRSASEIANHGREIQNSVCSDFPNAISYIDERIASAETAQPDADDGESGATAVGDKAKCPEGYYRGSLGYGNGFTCMPYGDGTPKPSKTRPSSGISGQ